MPEWLVWWAGGSGVVIFGLIMRWLAKHVTVIKGPSSPGGASQTQVQAEWNRKFPYDEI